MINIAFIVVYFSLLFQVIKYLKRRDFWKLIIALMLFLTFSPMMQYVYFPEYKQDAITGLRYLGFKRVWLEYCHVFLLLYIYSRIPFSNRNNKTVVFFATTYLILNALQFFTSFDISRSFNGYVVSVINPTIFGLIVNKILSNYSFSSSSLTKGIFDYYFVILIIFYVISVVNFFRVETVLETDYEGLFMYGLGNGLGVFRDRILMTEMLFFITLIFVPLDRYMMRGIKRKYFIMYTVGSMLLLLLSNSRTMYLASVLLIIILLVFNPFKNRKSLFLVLFLNTLVIVAINAVSSGSDISEIVFNRFHNKGTSVVESAKDDERYMIWESAKSYAEKTDYLGIGIGNFSTIYTKNYSNAHSLYYSVLVERGGFVLCWLLVALLTIIVCSYKKICKNNSAFFWVVILGVILYALISYTGEELFNVSQVVYSLSPYFIFLMLSICLSRNILDDEKLYRKNI